MIELVYNLEEQQQIIYVYSIVIGQPSYLCPRTVHQQSLSREYSHDQNGFKRFTPHHFE